MIGSCSRIAGLLLLVLIIPACGNSSDGGTPQVDTVAPASVVDLSASALTASSISVSWTAPGDDGMSGTAAGYDLRYSTSPITLANWPSAQSVGGVPSPALTGTSQNMAVSGLNPSTLYYFALKTSDEVPNVSGLSNIASTSTTSPPDTTAPGAVSDLRVESVSATSVTLQWTAPGDDGNVGTAASYDVRYSPAPIDAANWPSATLAIGEPTPSPVGSNETFTVTGLTGNTVLYFALRSTDESTNESTLSNVVWTGVFDPFVAYVTNKPSGTAWALFTTNISGTFRVNLTQGFPYSTDTNGFPFGPPYGYRWSPDGHKMLFLADTTANGDPELYVVNSAGGTPLKLSPPTGTFGRVEEFAWSPNGLWVSMVVRIDTGQPELWAVRVDGTQRKKVSGTPAGSWGVGFGDPSNPSSKWAPDSSRLLYLARENQPNLAELYTVTPEGTLRAKVSALTAFNVYQFEWAPSGAKIAYVSSSSQSPSIYDLYTTMPDTSSNAVLITGAMRNNFNWNFRWAPDSSRIAYMIGSPGGVLWSSLPDGTGALNLSGNAGVGMGPFEWAPDGSRIACSEVQLYTVLPSTASSALPVTVLTGGEGVRTFSWAPNSSRIAYSVYAFSDYKAYTTLPTDSTGNVIVTPSNVNPIFDGITWAPTSDRLAYVYLDLFSTLPTTIAGHLAVSPTPVPGGGVGLTSQKWTADGLRLLYLGYMEQISGADLYITDRDSSANNVRLSGPLNASAYVHSYVLRP